MYIWQKKQWEKLMQRKGSLPHAILLHGRSGIGKHVFAESFAHALLCPQASPTGQACGECQSCQWLKEGAHPDFKWITPEDDSATNNDTKKKSSKKSQISVAQIRQLYEYLSLSTHQVSGHRIILISPAESLNIASANALLKMLEEPPFLLVASQLQRLLPTIISRCQTIDLPMPNQTEALSWLLEQGLDETDAADLLTYAGGAPLAAMAMQSQLDTNQKLVKQLAQGAKLNPSASAPLLLSLGMEQAVEVLQKWTFDLINVQLQQKAHYHVRLATTFQALCKSVNLSALMQFQRKLTELKQSANHPLSNEMQLENILVQYTRTFNV